MAKAYREANSLSFVLEVYAPPSHHVRCDVRMSAGKLYNVIHLADEVTTVLLVTDGKVREHRLQ